MDEVNTKPEAGEQQENPTVDNITQAYTSILENFIKKKPEQYFWFHRRWKTKNINDKNIKP